jgi:hypothetical protein
LSNYVHKIRPEVGCCTSQIFCILMCLGIELYVLIYQAIISRTLQITRAAEAIIIYALEIITAAVLKALSILTFIDSLRDVSPSGKVVRK